MAGMETSETVSLEDKWNVESGRVVMTGTQAVVRVLLAQRGLDRLRGLNTAGYVTGYRGSPLGNVDMTLWELGKRLDDYQITFQPGLNEDIAATAVSGTQALDFVPDAKVDGVFAAWYAKGPGVDRSGDAFRHGNIQGAHRHGGVLVFYGDDHAGKSSTVSHQSEQALAASRIPSFYPSSAQEILEFGLLGIALSRYSGCWVGIKCVGEVAEQTATVDIQLNSFAPVLPEKPDGLPDVNARLHPFNPLGDERHLVENRLPLVHRFVRANGIDKVSIGAERRALGIVAAGKSYGDVRAALALLGLNDRNASRIGISLYKVGCIWPLEPVGLSTFAQDQATLFFVEEKDSFVERQAASILINDSKRPRVVGKLDEHGNPLLSAVSPLEPADLALAIAARLDHLGLLSDEVRTACEKLAEGSEGPISPSRRTPYFCAGCPHSRSTLVPEGSLSMTGIGCHTMALFARPEVALPPAQMGGEGGNWIGLAPFTNTKHMFQNMGEGTYYHSGLLGIRAAVASGVNITFKILYNDAVAMTGGQPVDGPISVVQIAHQVRSEGVKRVVLLSDDPERHTGNPELPRDIAILHRDQLDAVQRDLRETPGCTVLIYEQTCAAEKRRRRKRGTFPNPPKRMFIAKSVCEGCGDCSVQSTCVSLLPVETEFGRKRAIDQSSCNKDYSCADGFCPSFVTVYDAEPRKPQALKIDDSVFAKLPAPVLASIGETSFNIMVTGIGGTGVITVAALLGMAAHMEGLSMSSYDMTGLSQKNGAVYSHLRIARLNADIPAQRLSRHEADTLLAFDLMAALAPEASHTLSSGRTRAVVNADVAPTAAFQFNRDAVADPGLLLAQLRSAIGDEAVLTVPASSLAQQIFGDTIGANLFLTGIASQKGLLPVGTEAIERAVNLNGVAVSFNIRAFRLGRLHAVEPETVLDLVRSAAPQSPPFPATLDAIVAHRAAHLQDYQNEALADRYRALVDQIRRREAEVAPESDKLALAVARNYAKLLAYKDEYEVARLLTSDKLRREIEETFGIGGQIAFNMAPPILTTGQVKGRPKKREFGRWILPVLRILVRARGVRGTIFDPFARSEDRKVERALIREYEALVAATLPALTADNHLAAVLLLEAMDSVRGYGPVKEEAVRSYRTRVAELTAQFQRGPAQPVADALTGAAR